MISCVKTGEISKHSDTALEIHHAPNIISVNSVHFLAFVFLFLYSNCLFIQSDAPKIDIFGADEPISLVVLRSATSMSTSYQKDLSCGLFLSESSNNARQYTNTAIKSWFNAILCLLLTKLINLHK